jgi:hypothetical protein
MKIGWYHCWTFPWREDVLCCLGPTVLNDGDQVYIGLGLFFLEVGITFRRRRPFTPEEVPFAEPIYVDADKDKNPEMEYDPTLPIGSPRNPVDNLADAWKMAKERGLPGTVLKLVGPEDTRGTIKLEGSVQIVENDPTIKIEPSTTTPLTEEQIQHIARGKEDHDTPGEID